MTEIYGDGDGGGVLPRAASLSSVVGSYKSAVTRAVRRAGSPFAWQPRFYDHVVRDARALQRIRVYIGDNPIAWSDGI